MFERPRAEPAAVHRAEHLDVADRVEPEGRRDAIAHHGDQLGDRLLRVGGIEEVEIRGRSAAAQAPASDPG